MLTMLCLLSGASVGETSTDDLDAYLEQAAKVRKACGPTSVWYCLRRLGHPVKLHDVWDAAPITAAGIRGSDVMELLQKHGVAAQALRTDPARLHTLPIPAILIIDDKHCVVYEEVDSSTNRVRYFEPALGTMRSVPREEMQRHWSGEAVVFQTPALSTTSFAAIAFLGFAGVLAVSAAWRWFRLRRRLRHGLAAPTELMPAQRIEL